VGVETSVEPGFSGGKVGAGDLVKVAVSTGVTAAKVGSGFATVLLHPPAVMNKPNSSKK
jgi:hypothetical protein